MSQHTATKGWFPWGFAEFLQVSFEVSLGFVCRSQISLKLRRAGVGLAATSTLLWSRFLGNLAE